MEASRREAPCPRPPASTSSTRKHTHTRTHTHVHTYSSSCKHARRLSRLEHTYEAVRQASSIQPARQLKASYTKSYSNSIHHCPGPVLALSSLLPLLLSP